MEPSCKLAFNPLRFRNQSPNPFPSTSSNHVPQVVEALELQDSVSSSSNGALSRCDELKNTSVDLPMDTSDIKNKESDGPVELVDRQGRSSCSTNVTCELAPPRSIASSTGSLFTQSKQEDVISELRSVEQLCEPSESKSFDSSIKVHPGELRQVV